MGDFSLWYSLALKMNIFFENRILERCQITGIGFDIVHHLCFNGGQDFEKVLVYWLICQWIKSGTVFQPVSPNRYIIHITAGLIIGRT